MYSKIYDVINKKNNLWYDIKKNKKNKNIIKVYKLWIINVLLFKKL